MIQIELAGTLFPAVIDTGFESGLQLPDPFLPVLNPPVHAKATFQYADGSSGVKQTYLVRVGIDGEEYETETVFAPVNEIMVGYGLLWHFRLTIDYPAGTVRLEKPGP
jgi:predicted aspartyl protease